MSLGNGHTIACTTCLAKGFDERAEIAQTGRTEHLRFFRMSAEVSKSLPSDRGQHLLRVLIHRYIRDGQPVGSRTLSKDPGLGLSPATIRNVMSDLEDMGLVSAPHTSAGRVPTPQGYRLFVDTLVRYRQPDEREIRRIRKKISSQSETTNALVSTVSSMLSDFTHMAGVVSVPRTPK